jgi:PAS domain S-box-containing protein
MRQQLADAEMRAELFQGLQQEVIAIQVELTGQLSALHNAAIVSETDPAGRIISANDHFVSLTGYSHHELMGQDHRILKSDDTSPEKIAEMWRTLNAGHVWRGQLKNRAKDGRVYWVDAAITPVRDEQGQLLKFISVQFDVTAEKQQELRIQQALDEARAQETKLRQKTRELENAQESMQRAQLRLNSLVYALDYAAIVSETDPQGRITSMNERFLKTTGYSREELIGQNHRLLKSGHMADKTYEDLWATITKGHIWRGEFKNRTKNGTLFWVTCTITPVRSPGGKIERFIAISFDVTSQKLQEEQTRAALEISQLQENELRQYALELEETQNSMRRTQFELRGLVAALNYSGLVVETDLRGHVQWANTPFCLQSGFSREELMGKNLRLLKSGQHNESFYADIWDSLTQGQVWRGDICNRSRDGQLYWVRTTITPIMGFDNKPVKYISIGYLIPPDEKRSSHVDPATQSSLMQLQTQNETLQEQLRQMHQITETEIEALAQHYAQSMAEKDAQIAELLQKSNLSLD